VNVEAVERPSHVESGLALNTTKYTLEDALRKWKSIGTSLYF
jgi:hypothetical protein